ncbi:alpha-hydroxy-acid oxidizing protein [Aquibacillus sediminis]|uniref:alpha-hydroxy-acid oxidizing protein n=1 Tax=Aquibacillus sediminis TaxID=2574734 RepID=UPI001108CD1D|nr:alpha-hydroxy-acid oxidizing protein [Aquibacillus sediminis]
MSFSYKSNDNVVQSIDTEDNFPISFEKIETAAKQAMSKSAFSYIASGAGGEETAKKNTDAFKNYSIVPRLLNDVSNLNTSITMFGHTYPTPLLLAPVGVLKLADEQGDLAVARAAAKYDVPYIQSTVSSYSIEDVAQATSGSSKWFQLYWCNHEEISFNMVKRAEEAGYEAIVLTIDTITLGYREKDLHHRFSPLALGYGQGNFESDREFLSSLSEINSHTILQGIIDNINYPALNWKHVKKLKESTSLPIILKGVLHPEDALQAIEYGIDGVIVSNHGGRQLDGVISSIDALPDIVKVVDSQVPVLFDSGIRRGIDAIKALALGADAVLIGRPYVYSLAVGGEEGVEQFLANFLQDLQTSMMLSGVKNVKELCQLNMVGV